MNTTPFYYLHDGTTYRIDAESWQDAACIAVQTFGAFIVGNLSRHPQGEPVALDAYRARRVAA